MGVCLGVFGESTVRGLRFYSKEIPDFLETAAYVEFIGNVWKVISLKTPSKGNTTCSLTFLLFF